MARKYRRDNRGRFAGGGGGATARGGRLRTASGKKRATQTMQASAAPKGTIGKPKGLKPGAIKVKTTVNKVAANRIKAAAPKNTTANKTGQSKTLNKFNSRPVGTMVAGKGINLVPSAKRVPLDIQRKSSDEAFARMATKTAKVRAAAPAKAAAKQTTAQRASRAASNQKRVVASIQSKGGRRPTPSRKQRRSLLTAEAAKRFYSSGAIDRLNVNVKKPGFRLPRGMR